MLSKRNFVMMMTMNLIILVLFLFSVVLREYFNDYDVNHAAQVPVIEKKEGAYEEGSMTDNPVIYVGTEENGYDSAFSEWAAYRKRKMEVYHSYEEAEKGMEKIPGGAKLLLMDGKILEKNTQKITKKLSGYVRDGGVVIFYRLPSYGTISSNKELMNLLGIQQLRGESVELFEIRLYKGFLLGGDTRYILKGMEEEELVDLEREIPWYDISSRTKSYMVGFLSEEEKNSMGINNEDMPAIIWRSNMDKGSVFAVNGDYMKGEAALGFLDAMVYESEEYALYPVVNAQNLSVTGFPDLTVENEEKMAETYGMTNNQFCRDVLWPSLVAGAEKGKWKITSFLSIKQSNASGNEPNQSELIDYLKFFNEEGTEAGATLGRIEDMDVRFSVADERNTLDMWERKYTFAGGYVRKENKEQITNLIDGNGKMEFFPDIRTVVGEYEEDTSIISWMTDQITLQNATTSAYRHTYKDSLWLKSLETSLGYSNIQVDMYRVLWPESRKDEWQTVAEKMAANIDTYWKPFATFDKTTISESDYRVRNFLNGSVESTRSGDQISIRTKDFVGDHYLMLRTHGEILTDMTGGDWKEVEEDTYLLHLTGNYATLTVKPAQELYYTE